MGVEEVLIVDWESGVNTGATLGEGAGEGTLFPLLNRRASTP